MTEQIKYQLTFLFFLLWMAWRGQKAYKRGEDWRWFLNVPLPAAIGLCIGDFVYTIYKIF